MKPLTLKLRTKPPCQVDAAPLLPAALAGKSRDAIARFVLTGWNQTFAVGDLFSIAGDDAARLVVEDAHGTLIRIGAGLDSGELTVVGRAGDYAGEGMRGGSLTVRGDAGDFIGAAMRGGTLTVDGDVGLFAGSARAGETKGMAGGCIVIRGNAGERAGDRMRRGLLLIEGDVGDYCASRMIAGTLVALGRAGLRTGYLMRRGSLFFADPQLNVLPTFNHNGHQDLLAIRLLLDSLSRYGAAFRDFAKRVPLERWLGDLGCEGKGEMFIAR